MRKRPFPFDRIAAFLAAMLLLLLLARCHGSRDTAFSQTDTAACIARQM